MMRALIAAYVLTTSSALISLKYASGNSALLQFVHNRLQVNFSFLAALGIFLYGTSFLLYTYLISKFDLGYIIPLTTALVYILIFTASAFIFNENFTVFKLAGIALILGGVVLINIKT